MTEPSTRSQLELAQADVKRLTSELAAWPAVSPERAQLERSLEQQTAALAKAEQAQRSALGVEAERRNQLDVATGPRGRWWMSWLAPVLVIAGFIGACAGSLWAIEHLNWPSFADHYGVAIALVPPVVNGLRVLVAGGRWLYQRRRAT